MIAQLTGTVASTDESSAVIDVGGVGYLVFAPARTLATLERTEGPVTVQVETHVREDHIHLYAFLDPPERSWFRHLQTVQGVGARMALAILSVLEPRALGQAIAAQDKAALSRADGVGPKLAARIVAELKDKAGEAAFGLGPAAAPRPGAPAAVPDGGGATADAVSALINLGYGRSEAFGAVSHATRELGETAPLDALIKAGLKELAG